uniref:Uncharacterized protein n=1 Tax=Amphimedon queenslandica TaxID=400682 RepID=A0A1X7UXF4_AMPQE
MTEADIARLLHADTEQQKYKSAPFIMRLHEINRLPQSVLEDVVSSSHSLYSNTFKRLYAGVHQRIAETGHNINISDIFDELQDPFAGLETAYLQEQYINTEFKVLSIFLSTAVNYSIVEQHGMNEALKPFVEELNKLALSEIEVLRNGTKMYKGALVAFLADYLASHTVGGFKQSMSFARHFCFSCMATKDDSRKHFTAEKFKSRTPEEHEISEDDMYYKCFLMVLKILNIVMSPNIIHKVLPYLRVLIEEHHSLFVELYPNESFIPKLHYLIHYPKQIEEQRPMVRAWTMRYKEKLKYFKGVSRSGNFKNITYTLAKRHQKWLAYHLQTRSMFTPECTRGPILSTVSLSEDSDDI